MNRYFSFQRDWQLITPFNSFRNFEEIVQIFTGSISGSFQVKPPSSNSWKEYLQSLFQLHFQNHAWNCLSWPRNQGWDCLAKYLFSFSLWPMLLGLSSPFQGWGMLPRSLQIGKVLQNSWQAAWLHSRKKGKLGCYLEFYKTCF